MKILVLPGLDGMADLRSEFCAQLSSDFESRVVEYPVNLTRYDDLLNWTKGELPLQDYVVVAESFSGPLAIQLAAGRPKQLKGLVFVASFAKAPRKFPVEILGLLQPVPFRSRMFSKIAQPMMMGAWRNPAFTNLFHDIKKLVPGRTICGRLRELLSTECTAQLDMIDVPYIYLGASDDRLVPKRAADDFRHGAKAVRSIAGPHFLLQAEPKIAAEHVKAFVASLD